MATPSFEKYKMTPTVPTKPSFFQALIPVVYLVVALSLNVSIFGNTGLQGSNQIIILSAAAIAAAIAMFRGIYWEHLQEGIKHNINSSAVAILILLMVGALTGTWLLSGIIPLMIYYGLLLLSPLVFLPAAVVISALVSISTGSSWTTAATIGIALMGIGGAMGMNPAMVAGAVISGAYFGDKISPMSDTTNLASGIVGVPLFTHIRYMLFTTIPSILITLVLFLIIGLTLNTDSQIVQSGATILALQERFDLNPLLLIAPATVILMVVKKAPALPAIFVGVLLGAVFAVVFQLNLVQEIGAKVIGSNNASITYVGLAQSLFGDIAIKTGSTTIDGLLMSYGMAGMLKTIWLIISAMTFGGIMEASGMLGVITTAIMSKVHNHVTLVTATAGTCLLINVTASDQYLAIVLPGKMFPDSFQQIGLQPQNLSRTLEDAGTVTSVLVPWNTCGAYHAGVLGVATLSYLPFCFFNLISPLMTILYAVVGIKIARLDSSDIASDLPVASLQSDNAV